MLAMHLGGKRIVDVARAYGISRQCAYELITKAKAENGAG